MVEVSCFYVHYNRDPVNFTFIKYDNFMKIILQKRKIIIKIENLKNYEMLYHFYILSLLCTEDTSNIYKINDIFNEKNFIYAISTQKFWKNLHLTYYYTPIILEKNQFKNPLLSKEPKKETGIKKQNKLLKMMSNYYYNGHIFNPLYYIDIFLKFMIDTVDMEQIIQHEKMIYILCCLRGFNKDIYTNIMKFIKV